MLAHIIDVATKQAGKYWSVLATAALITFLPRRCVEADQFSKHNRIRRALTYFLTCVAIVLVIEGVFSWVFETAFSDLIHHLYPVLFALLSVGTMYLFLLLLWSKNLTFAGVAASTLFVGGTALLVLISTIFVLLGFDFAANYEDVLKSSCETRTIMCLISGDTRYEYTWLEAGKDGNLGWSFRYILLLIFLACLYYSTVLARVLKHTEDIAFWRSYVAIIASFIVLAPTCLIVINAVYRAIYGS